MSIIRSKRDRHYTVIDNAVFESNQLSFQAIGLLSFLLSKPDDWKVNIQALVNHTAATNRAIKAGVVYSLLKELIDAGFVLRKKRQSGEVDYIIFDNPENKKQHEKSLNTKSANCEIRKLRNPQIAKSANCVKRDVLVSTEVNNQVLSNKSPSTDTYANASMSPADAGDEFTLGDSPKKQAPPINQLIDVYNQTLGDVLPNAQIINAKRKASLSARWREMLGSKTPSGKVRYYDLTSGLEWWSRLFAKVKLNPHWLGASGTWRADLDWILNPSNFAKVLEYRPAQQQAQGGA